MTDKTDIAALTNERLLEIKSILSGFEDGYDTVDDRENYEAMRGAQLLIDELISLRDQLEAERQQREAAEAAALAMRDDMRVAREELAALRGDQEPVGYFRKMPAGTYHPLSKSTAVMDMVPLFTRQSKPVVVLSDCDIGAVSHMAHWYSEEQCEAWVAGVEHAKRQMQAAGIVVKDGE